jgi:hypothetical protein
MVVASWALDFDALPDAWPASAKTMFVPVFNAARRPRTSTTSSRTE